MKTMILTIAVTVTLSACAGTGTRTVTDSGGARTPAVALKYSDDEDTCLRLAHESARISDIPRVWYNWIVRPATLYLVEPKTIKFQQVLIKCMENRGHSVLDTEYLLPRW